MSKPYDGETEELAAFFVQHLDFTANLESSYEALCKSYSTFTDLLYQCYVDLKRSEEYSDLPESTSFIIGSLSAAYYEIRTSKDLIERVIKVTKALERK